MEMCLPQSDQQVGVARIPSQVALRLIDRLLQCSGLQSIAGFFLRDERAQDRASKGLVQLIADGIANEEKTQ